MLQPGQIFAGRYCIRQLIGSGAVSDVYEVRHVLTEHALTLKVLLAIGGFSKRGPSTGAYIEMRLTRHQRGRSFRPNTRSKSAA